MNKRFQLALGHYEGRRGVVIKYVRCRVRGYLEEVGVGYGANIDTFGMELKSQILRFEMAHCSTHETAKLQRFTLSYKLWCNEVEAVANYICITKC